MKKFIDFLFTSNHMLHAIGGVVIYMILLLASPCYAALIGVVLVASALEFKDKQWGGKFDWVDFIFTIIIPLIACILELVLI